MKKRIICLLLALVFALGCTSAFAAKYDGLWEKMQLQMTGNGLKGSLSLSATGDTDWARLVNALFQDTTLEFRGIQSDEGKQYQVYFQRGEAQQGLTRLFSDNTSWVLSSDLAGTEKVRLTAAQGLLQQLTAQEAGLNPNWYSVALEMLQLSKDERTSQWEPVLAKYEQALELWLADYASAPEVQREPGQETCMLVTYEIPVAALKAEAAALVRSMLGDDSLRGLLSGVMSEEQQQAYLNADWADYYDQRIAGLDLGGDATLERKISLTGDTLYTKVLLPLAAEQTGYDTLMLYQTGDTLTCSVAGANDTLVLELREMTQSDTGLRLSGMVERQTSDDTDGFKTEFTLVQANRESVDDDGRQHEYKNFTLNLTPEGQEPMTITALIHLHSKSANFNPTTLAVDATWTQGDKSLTLSGTLKTASAWVLQAFDDAGVKDWASLSAEDKAAVLAGYAAGVTTLVNELAAEQDTATATDLNTDTLTMVTTTPTDMNN